MNRLKHLALLLVLFSFEGRACEDTVPGALPPGFYGGVIEPFRESKAPSSAGDEGKAKNGGSEMVPEAQYFFEAIYRDKELRLYPIAIQPPKTSLFTKLSPERDLSEIRAEAEFPWEGKTVEIPLKVSGDAFVAHFDSGESHRFIVHLRAVHAGRTKWVNLQLENGD